MIDQNLIQQIVSSTKASLDTAIRTNEQLSMVQNVFPSACIDKIKTLVELNKVWKPVAYHPDSRLMIDWIPESIVEELHIAGELLTDKIKQYYSIDNIKLQSLQIWKDTATHSMSMHQDNPVIDVALQVYLFNNDPTEGTTFDVAGNLIDVPFKSNNGYLLWKKSNEERIPHKPTKAVSNGERITLYLTWSRFGKQAPDAEDPAALL